ncbi:hypothetical protein H310_08258 [Aphanomyces invadans]|uniref:Uncharacterized protein n=1 Tax=Aphanomyces invadans TaxID=157072 RepID=A0A024U1W5_9STRA|nr:hypothetical protein H310_08258 [Aphanomyces invadans]ETV99607.1 hypothetical protein H310_08258 [Aphanomyces invadans]|eukprot:XP_008872163.1 hypothetical protein H310_08258 [Aphanomyces invadans]
MKYALVCMLILAAVAYVAAENEPVPAGVVVYVHAHAVSAPAESIAVESAEATSPDDIVQDFEKLVRTGMKDLKTIASLVQLIRTIATTGLNADNGKQFVAAIQKAIQIGDLRGKDGKDLVKDIKAIVVRGQVDGPKVVADIMKVLEDGMKTATVADLISDLQKVIQNASKDVTTTLNLVKQIQSIQRNGLNVVNGAQLVLDIRTAISAGILHVKDGANLVRTIEDIVKNGMSLKDGALVVEAIQKALEAALTPFDPLPRICRRKGVGRGVGTVLENQCKEGEEAYGALCYPTCMEGYEKIGCCICRKKGCSGAKGVTDIGVSCTKPAAYGRGVGYALWQEDKCKKENGGRCEKNGLMWYPQCRTDFHPVGCCICSPNCPAGTTDDGAFCRKSSYGVGVGVSRLGCPADKEQSGALCYRPCATSFIGIGPVCWSQCSGDTPFKCGLFCTSSAATCSSSTVQIIGSAIKVALSLFNEDYPGAAVGVAEGGKKIITISQCS